MENSVYRILTLQEINKIAFLKVLGLVYYKYDNVNIGCFFLIMAFHFFITFFVRKYTLLCWDGWKFFENFNIVVVQPLSHVQLFATPQTAAQQASLSLTISQSLLQLIFIKSVMPSNHLVLCCPFSSCLQSFSASGAFLMSQLFASGGQSIGSSASVLVLWMYIQGWFPLDLTGWISLQDKGLSRVFSNPTVQKHQFFSTQSSLCSSSHIHTRLLEKP